MNRPRTAFSTLGCPGASVAEVCELAVRSGWNAVELRVCAEEPVSTALTKAERGQVRSAFAAAGVEVVCLASYVRVGDPEVTDAQCAADLLDHLHLARDLRVRAVRVFPGAGRPGPAADATIARRLRAAADAAVEAGVTLLLETHDSHPGGRDVARVLNRVDHPAVSAVWDVLHSWLAGEPPAVAARALAPWLAHVQLKDAASRTDLTPVALGTGAVPLDGVLTALDGLGYAGFLSLEWERRWYPAADPLPQALVTARAWLQTRTS